MGGVKLIVSDFIISFMWPWTTILIKIFMYNPLGLGFETKDDIIRCGVSVINMFVFAWFSKLTKGGAYNPLMVLAPAMSGDYSTFLYTVGARIPAQIIGSITGVSYIIKTYPELGHRDPLNIDIHRGALTEGFFTFIIVLISLGLTAKIPGSFFRKTWISSISKVALYILSADLTGGYMNPASVIGWAYASGKHLTKEHLLVYWIAPIGATILAVQVFRLVVRPMLHENAKANAKKSD
ncbi:Aquaporin protein 24 [Heracleum sosnowskyi]|uniref:Aquaporin protein 24 n=1 Tax=Heracleum sosnowskyi TaxID=360622 RepID=A0AAD8MBE2_9APIA|nr:Aquaporin protein 24 [Heracleum sosnowskyi]